MAFLLFAFCAFYAFCCSSPTSSSRVLFSSKAIQIRVVQLVHRQGLTTFTLLFTIIITFPTRKKSARQVRILASSPVQIRLVLRIYSI